MESDIKGGKTLTVLSDAVRVASGKCELLMQNLLETAAVPYMQQLHVWLTQGVVDDPYSEFLIEDNQVNILKRIKLLLFLKIFLGCVSKRDTSRRILGRLLGSVLHALQRPSS